MHDEDGEGHKSDWPRTAYFGDLLLRFGMALLAMHVINQYANCFIEISNFELAFRSRSKSLLPFNNFDIELRE